MGGNGRYHSSVSSADGGSGGGGRVAIYYGASTFPFNNISVRGGDQGRSRNGGTGTIYIKKDSDAHPELIFDSDDVIMTNASVTPVWFGARGDSSDDPPTFLLNLIGREEARLLFEDTPTVVVAETVSIANSHLFIDQLTVDIIDITDGGILSSLSTTSSMEHSLDLKATDTLTIDSTSRIDVSSQGYTEGRNIRQYNNWRSNG